MNMRYAMRSEDTEQINVVSWANWNMNRYPELKWLHHVPNGGSRNKQEAVKLKQMGVKAGVIKKYLSLNSWRMNDVMIVMGRASGKQDAIEKMVMDIPNNSILKNGEIKESKPRKK